MKNAKIVSTDTDKNNRQETSISGDVSSKNLDVEPEQFGSEYFDIIAENKKDPKITGTDLLQAVADTLSLFD